MKHNLLPFEGQNSEARGARRAALARRRAPGASLGWSKTSFALSPTNAGLAFTITINIRGRRVLSIVNQQGGTSMPS